MKINAHTTLADLIDQVRARIREALAHQRVSLSEIKAGLPSLTGELYAIAVNVMKFNSALKFGGLVTATHNLSNGPVDDMSISVFEQPCDGGLQIALNGNVNRYEVAQLATHYQWFMVCLEQVCRADPATPVDAIDWISQANCALLVDTGAAPHAQEPALDDRVGADEPNSEREVQICKAFARAIGVDVFPVRENFFQQGGHSLLAARLVSALAKELKVKIPLRALFDHPTPRALARYLSAPSANLKSDLPLLVLCPGAGLLSREMIDLRDALQVDFSISLVEYPDWRREWEVISNVHRYLNFIVAQITAVAPEPRPLSLVGYSLGASVAYAVSIVLAGLGYTIEQLNILDGRSPVMQALPSADHQMQSRMKRIVKFASSDSPRYQLALGRLVGINAKKPLVKAVLRYLRPMMPEGEKNEFLLHMTHYINASIPMQGIRDWTAAIARDARLVAAPVVLFRSIDNADNWPRDLGWTELAPKLEIVPINSSHFTIFNEHNLATVYSHIRPKPMKQVSAVGPRLNVLAPSDDASRNGPALRGRPMPELLQDELLSEIFAATVARTPNRVCMTTLEGKLTYVEVDARATAIARGLVRRGAKAGEVVGLWLERGVDVLISQVAIAKTGATWLPLDSDAPIERIAACLRDASARLLIADTERIRRANGVLRCPAIDPAAIVDAADQFSVDARALGATPDNAAYLIYTSGSTGEPKGIVVSNRNICHFLRAINEVYGITSGDVMFQNASMAFDLSMEQIWLPYLVGASLFVADASMIYEIDELPRRMERAGVTVLDTLPTLLAVLPRDVETLRIIILGGEVCTPAIVERWAREGRAFYNTYGRRRLLW